MKKATALKHGNEQEDRIMKTRNLLLMAVAAMASAACMEKETEVTPAGNEEIICEADAITAFCENEPDVRTSLSEGAVLWHNGDAIAVWNGTKAVEYVTDAQDGSASADFTTSDTGFEQVEDYLALYPYSDAAEFSAGKVKTVIPDVQTPVAGGFAKGTNVTVASGSADALEFRNVCGYVKFTVPEGMTDLTKVELSANSGESLAGEVEIAISSEPSAVVVEGNGKSSVVMEGTFEAGKSYYLAVLPKTLEGGFTMTLTRTEGTTTMNTTKAFTVTRSKAKPIGELYDGTWKVSLEGSAVPEGTAVMTNYGNGTISWQGQLQAGQLSLRVLYENAYLKLTDGTFATASAREEVSIPADGWYHIMLDEESDTYRIYVQDVYVDFGSRGESPEPWCNLKSKAAGIYSLDDSQGNQEVMSLTLGEGFNLYDSNTSVDERGNYQYKDIVCYMKSWYDGLTFSGSDKTTDAGPLKITLSGLDQSSEYDINIVGVRFNGSKTARETRYEIDSKTVQIQTGLKIADGKSGTYINYEAVPFDEYVAVFNSIKPDSEGNISINVTAVGTGTACDAHINAMMIYRNL